MKKFIVSTAMAMTVTTPAFAQDAVVALEQRLAVLEERVERLEGGDFPLAYVGEELKVGKFSFTFIGCEIRGVITECYVKLKHARTVSRKVTVKDVHLITQSKEKLPAIQTTGFGSALNANSIVKTISPGSYNLSFVFEGLKSGETYGLNFSASGDWARFRGYVQP